MEASNQGEDVRLYCEQDAERVLFKVWNQAAIPVEIQIRLFQRNFSTKKGFGRGLGTYCMKLLGEDFLGGKVGFRSSDKDGTEFWIALPC